ncbi:MAG: site-2 protease family protein, partial [Caldilineaceae bacterium]|nr:site-2 protease family protein [Caldilineaceae bacterium]
LDFSWFLIFALITWSMATSYYPAAFPGWSTSLYWLTGAATAVLLFVSVLLHELGHSVIALRFKIPVNRITLFIFGGVAEIGGEPPSAWAEFWIAIAGPVVSLVLALLCYLLQPPAATLSPLLALVQYLAYINFSLVLFNLIPGFPLDGGRVFRAIVWGATGNLQRATVIAGTIGRVIAYLFIIVGIWQIVVGNFANGLWIAFIGWFLESAAAAEVQRQSLHEQLAGHTVAQAMTQEYAIVPPQTNLQQLMEDEVLGHGKRCFVVGHGDLPMGLLTLHQISKVAAADRLHTDVDQIMLPLDKVKTVAPNEDLWEALKEMEADGVNQLPVIANGRLLGMLSRDGIISFLRTLHVFRTPGALPGSV